MIQLIEKILFNLISLFIRNELTKTFKNNNLYET